MSRDDKELIRLAYQAVTMTNPTEEVETLLTEYGIKRSLEVLLVMQQSPKKVKFPAGFIRNALEKNWNPNTIPEKITRKESNFGKGFSQKELLPEWFHEDDEQVIDNTNRNQDKAFLQRKAELENRLKKLK